MKIWKKLFSSLKPKAKTNLCTCKHGHCACYNKQLRDKLARFWEKDHSSH